LQGQVEPPAPREPSDLPADEKAWVAETHAKTFDATFLRHLAEGDRFLHNPNYTRSALEGAADVIEWYRGDGKAAAPREPTEAMRHIDATFRAWLSKDADSLALVSAMRTWWPAVYATASEIDGPIEPMPVHGTVKVIAAPSEIARDAARYRWLQKQVELRGDHGYADVYIRVDEDWAGVPQILTAASLDAAIDAAIEQERNA
jgi:hypothetical protein